MSKKIIDYTHDDLLKLSSEELSKLFDIEREEENKRRTHFEQLEYPNFTFEDKIKYWSGVLHRQMRWQVESGLDPYAIYDLEWYNSVKRDEPRIDEIMDSVFMQYWKGEWSKEEYQKRINSL